LSAELLLIPFPGDRTFHVAFGNLLDQPMDAIVNAANSNLAHGGGVAGAISRAAGPELDEASRQHVREHGPLPVGHAVVTTAGRLPFKGVVHAVGPVWGEGDEATKLASAVASALGAANQHGWRTIAMPAVSSGIFRVPLDICARAYLDGIARHLQEQPASSVQQVRLVLLPSPASDELVEHLRSARHSSQQPQ
jgi:O-acetyl-ADP-ribose deacetylase (regulator of RNase III)